jgi:hypothetical protein
VLVFPVKTGILEAVGGGRGLTDGSHATHHYWTNDPLLYNGSGSGACWVSTTSGSDCGGSAMGVCTASVNDPEGNVCNWQNCGFESVSPNEHFGGCMNNLTAGTLCCRR